MLSQEQRESLELAQQRYSASLEPVLKYLEDRGISEDTAISRGLGYVHEPIPGHKPAHGRLSIPYETPAGIVGFNFRCIQDHKCRDFDKHSKYWKPSGTEPNPYGVLDIFKDSLDIHVTEGEIDTITLSEMCGMPALGIPGAQNWRPWWKLVLSDFQRIFLWADPDDAGESMTRKFQKEMGVSVIPVHIPQGYDVNSLYLKNGPEYMRGLVQ